MVDPQRLELERAQLVSRQMTEVTWELAAALRFPDPWPTVATKTRELQRLAKLMDGFRTRASAKPKKSD